MGRVRRRHEGMPLVQGALRMALDDGSDKRVRRRKRRGRVLDEDQRRGSEALHRLRMHVLRASRLRNPEREESTERKEEE